MDGLSREMDCIRGLLASVRAGFLTLKAPEEARLMLVAQLDSVLPILQRLEANCREGAGVAQNERHRKKVQELQEQLFATRNENLNLRHMAEAARPLFSYLAGYIEPVDDD